LHREQDQGKIGVSVKAMIRVDLLICTNIYSYSILQVGFLMKVEEDKASMRIITRQKISSRNIFFIPGKLEDKAKLSFFSFIKLKYKIY
jgi:hypothetical protein